MKDIYTTLKERRKIESDNVLFMEARDYTYWIGLPVYAHMYIRPAYELITDLEGLVEFTQYFMVEYSETTNEFKKLCIEAVVFPIYEELTGRNFDVNLIAL